MARVQKKRIPAAGNVAKTVSQEEISREAFRLYQARHGAPGDPVADWFEAERLVKERLAAKATPKAAAAAAGATSGGARRFRSSGSARRRR